MNNWWNDPDDELEAPACCGEPMDDLGKGVYVCNKCLTRIIPIIPQYDTLEEKKMDLEQ